MRPNDVRRVTLAVANKTLPVCPGDMVCFMATGNRMFVVASSEQGSMSGSSGQQIAGMLAYSRGSRMTTFWLDWAGVGTAWSIHRTMV